MNIERVRPQPQALRFIHVTPNNLMMAALFCIAIAMHTIHSQNKLLQEIKQLNDGLLTRIDELEKQNRRLHLAAEFSTEHTHSLEHIIDAWRTSHTKFQSAEQYYQTALESARQMLVKCLNP